MSWRRNWTGFAWNFWSATSRSRATCGLSLRPSLSTGSSSRIGDYAESVARQVLVVDTLEPQPPYDKFIELGAFAVHMLREAVRAFLEQDAELALRTIPLEERANAMRSAINAEIRELNQSNRLPAAGVGPLVTIARRLERVTDQAKNLCEEVLYLCTGEFVKHKGAEEFHILFFDSNHNCLGQMAQGLATALRLPKFRLSTAAMAPQPVDARTARFMAAKGLDISGQTAKSLEAASPLGAVPGSSSPSAPGAQEAIPLQPSKTILFTWPIPDPLETNGPPEAVQAAFESAYHSLEPHLRDLVGAILREPHSELKL